MTTYSHDGCMRRQDLFLDGQHFASFQRPRSWLNAESGGWSVAQARVLVCPICLRQWCVMGLEAALCCTVHEVYCDQHFDSNPNPYRVAGSILGHLELEEDPLLLDFLPAEVLLREWELAERHLRRFL